MIKISDTVKHLIIINVLFFAASIAFKEQLYDLFAMHYPSNPLFKPWQIVSHLFMHGNFNANGEIDITHLLFNMIGLWMFGSQVEERIGKTNFIILYFLAGIGAVLFSLGIDYVQYQVVYNDLLNIGISPNGIQEMFNTNTITDTRLHDFPKPDLSNLYGIYHKSSVGASGALYGVMVASAMLFPKAKMGLMFLPIFIESRIFIPLILISEMYFGMLRTSDNIGHFAHIGGAIFGFLIIWMMQKNNFKNLF